MYLSTEARRSRGRRSVHSRGVRRERGARWGEGMTPLERPEGELQRGQLRVPGQDVRTQQRGRWLVHRPPQSSERVTVGQGPNKTRIILRGSSCLSSRRFRGSLEEMGGGAESGRGAPGVGWGWAGWGPAWKPQPGARGSRRRLQAAATLSCSPGQLRSPHIYKYKLTSAFP